MNFDIREVRRALLIIGIGYFFTAAAIFVSLSNIKILEAAQIVSYAAYPGITMIIVGTGLIFREHYYFKIAFFVNLVLGLLEIGLLVIYELLQVKVIDQSLYDLLGKIISTLINFCLLLGNNLVIQGLKAFFTKKKENRTVRFCTATGYIIDILILCSTVLSLVDFGNDFHDLGIILVVVFDFLSQCMIVIFMFIAKHALKKYQKN